MGTAAGGPRPQLAVGPRRPLTDGPNQVHGAVGDLADAHEFLCHRILELELALECRAGRRVRTDVNQRYDRAGMTAARRAVRTNGQHVVAAAPVLHVTLHRRAASGGTPDDLVDVVDAHVPVDVTDRPSDI